MRTGWLVMTETRWLGAVLPPMHKCVSRKWRCYRFRWAARAAVWMTNYVPTFGPFPIFSTARLLGRARMKLKHGVRSGYA